MCAEELLRDWARDGWAIDRRVVDRRRREEYGFRGVAEFARDRAEYVYEERGTLSSRDASHSARRRYLYRPRDGVVSVHFDDGRPFYAMVCSNHPRHEVRHECASDVYSGQMDYRTDEWTSRWCIVGPTKNIEIFTTYARSPRPARRA